MRVHAAFGLALGLVLATFAGSRPAALGADPVAPQGNYRLALIGPFAETELILARLSKAGESVEAKVLDTAALPQPPQVSRLSQEKDGTITLVLKIGAVDATFQGSPDTSGDYLGMIQIAAQGFPAKLARTGADKVTPPPQQAPAQFQAFMGARQAPDPKTRAARLREIVAKSPGDPTLAQVYATLLQGAAAGELDAATVRAVVDEWIGGARPYGEKYRTSIAFQALTALAGQEPFAAIALGLAEDVDRTLGADAPPQARAEVARALAGAARSAGKPEVAADAEAKLAKLEEQLDEEYRKSIPPFKPEREQPDAERTSDRVVLMELFTGAQCPPCVAADVAFDALHQVYKPTELVTLQYHLHIPGPDPLTNQDAEKRVEYYPDFGGTPTTIFDGVADAMGGGGLPAAEAKFGQFRQVIDRALKVPSRAAIDLKVDRDGEAITIRASAQVKGADEADAGKVGGSQPRLRLALVEEEVRYLGGNNLRFHHHVVRAMPGGVEGVALARGKGQASVTVKLGDLKRQIEQYLSDYVKDGGSFPRGLPPVELKNLKVVAFVQDDADKAVLNAAIAPVPAPK